MSKALAKLESFIATDAVELKFLKLIHYNSVWLLVWIEFLPASWTSLVAFLSLRQPSLYTCVAVDLAAFSTFNKVRRYNIQAN